MFDLLVLGGGPAGYNAAERAAHAGLRVAVAEAREVGGVCLNEGCVPTKTFLNSAKIYEHALHGAAFGVHADGLRLEHAEVLARKQMVVKKLVSGVRGKLRALKVDVMAGEARIIGRAAEGFSVDVAGQAVDARRLLIATGSSAIVPPLPGVIEAGKAGFVLTNREILDLGAVPARLVIIGGGVIGLEMACYFSIAGSDVTIVELLPEIGGANDPQALAFLKKQLIAQGVKLKLGCKLTAVHPGSVDIEESGATVSLPADAVLMSIGRRANASGIGLENIAVETTRAGIKTDSRMRTNIPGVWAAGDVNGQYMLAHVAYREGEVAVSDMLGRRDVMRYNAVPSVIYTLPEIAAVGATEAAARDAGLDVTALSVSARMSGRFMAESDGDGLCKLIIDNQTHRVVGAHMCCPYASEMIWGAAALIETELRVEDAREIIFPHPTVSELMREALFA